MAINFQTFKKKPLLWGGIAIVIFVIFYLIFSRGSGGGEGSTQVVTTGPSEAQLAAQTQLGLAQIQAGAVNAQTAAEVAMKNADIAGQVKLGELAYQAGLAEIQASKEALQINSEYSLQTARVAAETNLAMAKLDKDVLTTQLNAQSQMFTQQIQSVTTQALIAQIPSLKKKDRDNALAAIAGYSFPGMTRTYGIPLSGTPTSQPATGLIA